jgi:hypothetical protein
LPFCLLPLCLLTFCLLTFWNSTFCLSSFWTWTSNRRTLFCLPFFKRQSEYFGSMLSIYNLPRFAVVFFFDAKFSKFFNVNTVKSLMFFSVTCEKSPLIILSTPVKGWLLLSSWRSLF